MHKEIERKFIVKDTSILNKDFKCINIVQGYVGSPTRGETRISIRGNKGYICFKNTNLFERFEYDIQIELSEALLLQDNLCDKFVYKVRMLIPYKGLTIEVDIFSGPNQGLILAEVELPSADYEFDIPDWFGKEVTNDPRYHNSSLARMPYSEIIKHDLQIN